MVDDKLHARFQSDLSLVTQPLGGKAQYRWHVWVMGRSGLAHFGKLHGAAYHLQNPLDLKSDDGCRRVENYRSIVKGDISKDPRMCLKSFRVISERINHLVL